MMAPIDLDAVQWLHANGQRFSRSGQHQQGLVYVLIANQIAPQNTEVLHTLAQLFDVTGDGPRALAAIEHLTLLQGLTPAQLLLKSRALWNIGQKTMAQQVFQDYQNLQRRIPAL
jgi:type III secretion protein Y